MKAGEEATAGSTSKRAEEEAAEKTAGAPYKCEICGKSLGLGQKLIEHM